jgi:alpha-D-xyloside xylohydrolase
VLGTNGLLFARSGFTGSQAYPGYWAGDNQPNFNEPNGLPGVVIASQSAAMSGYSIWASDIGGYQNGNFSATQTNLFIRWTQFGAFSPLMQMHRQVDSSTLWQYPWGYGADALTNYIYYARLHTALFPYIYTLAVEGSTNGLPIMRPLVLMYPNDSSLYGVKQTFMFGNDLLISQIISGNATTRNVQLPQGNWYDFFTNVRYTGGQTIVWTNSNQSQMPLFVRQGAIVPMISSNVQTLCDAPYVGNPSITTMTTALEFMIYPGTNSSFTVYDGTTAQCVSNGTVVTTSINTFPRALLLRFFGPTPFGVERDGVPLPNISDATQFAAANLGWRYDAASNFLHVKFNHIGGPATVSFGPDSVGDGISDSWRQFYFGSATTTNASSCAACDADGDGLTNAQEYRTGTAPMDPANVLRIASVQTSGNDYVISFPSVSGMTYRVQRTDELSPSPVWETVMDNIAGTGGSISITDPGAVSLPRRFYRVRLLP